MSAIDDFLEDLGRLIDNPQPPEPNQARASDDPAYRRLNELATAVLHSPSMDSLNADELRDLNTFVITVSRAATMSPGAARAHVGAAWRPAEAGVLKLALGPEVRRAVHHFMSP